jgi:serine/threonine protein kinase
MLGKKMAEKNIF